MLTSVGTVQDFFKEERSTAATAGSHDKSAEQIVRELLAAVPIDTPLVVAVPIDLVAVPIDLVAEPSGSGADWADHAAKEISKAVSEEAEKVGQAGHSWLL